jgi:Kef-type K+ transport system membrane component KefB
MCSMGWRREAHVEAGNLAFAVLLLVLAANLLSALCARLRQPRVVGEILAGVLLGPSVLGALAPGVAASVFGAAGSDTRETLDALRDLGLLLLMFLAGTSVQHVLGKEDRKPTAWILAVGTPLPFLAALAVSPLLPLDRLIGPADNRTALVLVLATAVTVTSIPVIARIFHDLGILHTRFAGLVLGAAVLEDVVLWAVVAAATAMVGTTAAIGSTVTAHVLVALAFVAVGITVAPVFVRWMGRSRWNPLASELPVAWAAVVLLAYVSAASALDVTPVYAAFLAGFAVVGGGRGTERARLRVALDPLSRVAAAVFIPLAFAYVGYRLEFGRGFSPGVLAVFLVGSTVLCVASVGLAARLAGFRGLSIVNLALTVNARGGPGIVLASVAFHDGIINASFFTTLVITAVVTSQICGIWLDLVLRRGWPLLATRVDSDAGASAPTDGDAVATEQPETM